MTIPNLPMIVNKLDVDTPHLLFYEDDGNSLSPTPDRDDLEDDHYDTYVNSEVLLPKQGGCKTQ